MRNLIIILLSVLTVSAFGQRRVANVPYDGAVSGPAYVYLWGSTTDTLTNVDTATFVLRVKGDVQQDYMNKLYIDHVSGTAGGVLTITGSIDGVAYDTTLGTITTTGITSDGMDAEQVILDSYLYPYVKYSYIQSGTAVTVPKLYLYTKEN